MTEAVLAQTLHRHDPGDAKVAGKYPKPGEATEG